MKPTFALDLTRDAVALLHRTPKGWLSVGEVAFDAPDLDEALEYLRKTALGLSPMGMATKIVLPNSQVLYTEVTAPGPSRDEKRRQIAKALEGRTPYDVTDLVFDWSGKGATVKVAVVARETLQEAEGFAVAHRLNPVSFVAIPDEGDFVGEPFFGPTEAAPTILAEGESVEKDRDAVTILQRDLPMAVPAVAEAITVADPVEADDSLPGLAEALNADLPDPEPMATAPTPPEPLAPEVDEIADDLPGGGLPPMARAEEGSPAPAEASAIAPDTIPDVAPEMAADIAPDAQDLVADTASLSEAESPAPATVESPVPADVEAKGNAAKAEPAIEEVEEAPFAHVTDTTAFGDAEDGAPPPRGAARSVLADDIDDDIPPAPPSAALAAFASRRAAASTAAPAAGPAPRLGEAAGAPPPAPANRLGAAQGNKPASGKGFQGLVTAPSIPGTRPKPKGKLGSEVPRPAIPGPSTVKSPARPGGTFGTAAPPRNRTGIVFAVLVGMLLLFLAVLAAWSSLYLSRAANTPETDPATDLAVVEPDVEVIPDVEDEMLADMQDPEGMTDPLPEAEGEAAGTADPGDLATETALLEPSADPEAEPADETGTDVVETAAEPETVTEPEPVTVAQPETVAEPAPETAVATDVTAGQAPVEDQDEIFLSAMDAPPPALDALSLPTPLDTADAAPAPPMPPPVFGTVYKFDANGLLQPTPEGIVSPDGVFLVAGKPPVTPPARSEAAAAAAALAAAPEVTPEVVPADPAADPSLATADPAAAEEVVPTVSDPALSEFRPRSRPEGLTGTAEDDAGLATETDSDFAGLRPLPRPEIILAAASAGRPTEAADLGAQGASLTAQAEAQLAAAAALEAQNPSVVAISMRPVARPSDLSDAVEAAVAAAVREPEPELVAAAAPAPELKPEELDEMDEPDTAAAAPKIPTKASVAKQATYANAINLSKINLIGTYGTDSRRYALVRQSNGRYKKVKVGDKIDGGTVKAITETEVRYQKGGKLLALKMPKV
jgi:hypothetical protein